MPLPWVRLDTTFPTNPKVLSLVSDRKWRALSAYVCSLSYSGAHGTDGFIPVKALPFVHASTREAAELVEVGLWHKDRIGWVINDWADYQQTQSETSDILNAKRVGARKGNCHRWHPAGCECWRNDP
jgi:hypothetical protein